MRIPPVLSLHALADQSRTFYKALFVNVDPDDQARFHRQSVEALRPFVRIAAMAVGCYYIIITIANIYGERGSAFWVLTGLSLSASLICFALHRLYVRNTLSVQRLEITALSVCALMYINGIANQIYHFEAPKLVYFILILVIHAFSAPSPRWFVPSAVICMSTMLYLAAQGGTVLLQQYIWIALAGTLTASAMATAMRINLLRSVHARMLAEKMAHFDALTGLPNRRHFFVELNKTLGNRKAFDLALIDLDGFKPVNDIYGHSIGDSLLVEVGQRLTKAMIGRGHVARLGGDEFALILEGKSSDTDLRDFGTRLCENLRETYELSGGVYANISASIGFVHNAPDKGLNGSQLLERADYALYQAKQKLRGATVVFNARHESEMRDFGLVDQTLRSSDLKTELYILYQPQYDLLENKTIGFEALARWNSPKLGEVSPDVFISAAERSGLISDVTLILLKKALEAARNWPEDIRISFNLSTRDLRSIRAINQICKTVSHSGLDPRRIEFEITETAMLTDFEQSFEMVSKLKAMGARIALDDFGSGYSSLGYIHQLPVDKIKIDRSFATQLLKHESARRIIKTIIDLCDNLHLDHVVEGVETEAELEQLRSTGARFIQGYLFAKPLPASDIPAYLGLPPFAVAVGEAKRPNSFPIAPQ